MIELRRIDPALNIYRHPTARPSCSAGLRTPRKPKNSRLFRGLELERGMISLSQEVEVLARRLAQAKRLTVEDTIRMVLEGTARAEGIALEPHPRDQSAQAVAARRARTDKLVATFAATPIRDQRSPREILDDLNAS